MSDLDSLSTMAVRFAIFSTRRNLSRMEESEWTLPEWPNWGVNFLFKAGIRIESPPPFHPNVLRGLLGVRSP